MHLPPPELKVNWAKGYNGWLPLDALNLQDSALNDAIGVYILWNSKGVLKVGSGNIREGLAKDRTNREMMGHKDLMVTWCKLGEDRIEGVKSYLMENQKPKIEGQLIESDTRKMAVNIPW